VCCVGQKSKCLLNPELTGGGGGFNANLPKEAPQGSTRHADDVYRRKASHFEKFVFGYMGIQEKDDQEGRHKRQQRAGGALFLCELLGRSLMSDPSHPIPSPCPGHLSSPPYWTLFPPTKNCPSTPPLTTGGTGGQYGTHQAPFDPSRWESFAAEIFLLGQCLLYTWILGVVQQRLNSRAHMEGFHSSREIGTQTTISNSSQPFGVVTPSSWYLDDQENFCWRGRVCNGDGPSCIESL